MSIPTLKSLGMPEVFSKIARETAGLVLVTGATQSGRSTTLAALLNEINEHREVSVTTLESKVSFWHTPKKATFKHLELGKDFATFEQGVSQVVKQPQSVIVIEHIGDRETATAAFKAVEMGHLVFGSLGTIDVGQTINALLGRFPPNEQDGVRICLAHALRWVTSQRLAPRMGGGMPVGLFEIMGVTDWVKDVIESGEREGQTYYEITEACRNYGWQTFDHAAIEAYESGLITEEIAVLYCSKKGPVSRRIEDIKRRRGDEPGNA